MKIFPFFLLPKQQSEHKWPALPLPDNAVLLLGVIAALYGLYSLWALCR